MDLLKKENNGFAFVTGVGIVLLCAIVIVGLQHAPEAGPSQAPSPLPADPPPSKENVDMRVRERIEHLKEVVAGHPSESKAALELARTLQDAHDVAGALDYYELGLKNDPDNVEARVDYSLCLYQSGKEEQSLVQNTIVLRGNSTNPHALFNLGAIYGNRGMGDSAVFYWKRLIASHPDNELARRAEHNLGQLQGRKPAL